MKKKAVTLVEVLVATVLITLVFAGLMSAFLSIRNYVKRANKRLVAMNLMRHMSNDLYAAVREDTWSTGDLQTGTHNNIVNVTVDGLTYTGNYTVSSVSGYNYREADLNITYPD